jgi:hypothetical protein
MKTFIDKFRMEDDNNLPIETIKQYALDAAERRENYTYESYKDIEYLNKEIVLAIDASIKFNVDGQLITHHFTKSKEELEKDRDEDVQNSLFLISRYKNIYVVI